MMFGWPLLWVIVGILSAAIAQIVLKMGSVYRLLEIKGFIFIVTSLSFYAISFLSYFFALKAFEISKISPIMMSSTVIIIAIYGYITGEIINSQKSIGIALAVISIFMIARS